MKVKISGGSKNVTRTVRTADFDNENFESTMSHVLTGSISKKVENATKETSVISNYDQATGYTFNVVRSRGKIPAAPVVKEIVRADDDTKNKNNNSEEKKFSPDNKLSETHNKIPVAPKVVEIKTADKNTNKDLPKDDKLSTTTKPVESPFTIDSDYQKKCVKEESVKKDIVETSPVRAIEISINNICRAFNNILIDDIKEDAYANLILAITSMLPNNSKMFAMLISAARDILDADMEGEIYPETISVIKSLFKDFCDENDVYNEDIQSDNVVEDVDEEYAEEDDIEITENSKITTGSIKGIKTFTGTTVKINEILPTQDNDQKILVLTNNDGKYVCIDNYMIGVYEINDIDLNDLNIVSSEYVENLENCVNSLSSNNEEYPVNDEYYDTIEDVPDLVEKVEV